MLTDAQRTDARRFCGYAAYGAGAYGNMGWRFYQAYGALEYRLSNLSDAELVVITNMLATCTALELALVSASDNLDTSEAASWTHNASEIDDRVALLETWQRRLCAFLGLPPGPGIAQSRGSMSLIV
jgi:hypothetical protein